ncbi:MAG TPA: hypothetical protein VEY71_00905 [Chitinophagales bacterium]|nr:hypothetical protein [Chitinophagales bacterium]
MKQALQRLNQRLFPKWYEVRRAKHIDAHIQRIMDRDKVLVSFAFEIAGKRYYEIKEIFNLQYKRGLQAITVYEENRMKVDYEYLKAHCDAVNNHLTSNRVSIFELKKLNDTIRERLEYIADTDLLYKLASVVFFDENESPLGYDGAYNKQKIAFWREHAAVADFFALLPLQKLIPFLKDSVPDLKTFSETIEKLNRLKWDAVFTSLSTEQRKRYTSSRSTYATATSPSN